MNKEQAQALRKPFPPENIGIVETVDREIDELATLYTEKTRDIPVTPNFEIEL